MAFKEEITDWLRSLQDNICGSLEKMDGRSSFKEDLWERSAGGGGRTRIIQDGAVIEKGGVNFSAIHGKLPEFLAKELKLNSAEERSFYATGVSIVIHPVSPMVPIIHMNVRYFETSPISPLLKERSGHQQADGVRWFGGGIDLTPHYVVEEDAKYFHTSLKKTCDQHHPSYYPEFKKWADDYFFIKHRNETRGVGGIFFDHLKPNDQFTLQQRFAFVKSIGECFAPVYTHLVNKNKDLPYGEKEKQWQLVRRGRYVEFNLVYDRGTKFGMETDGRIESILMSLPKDARWLYNYIPEKNSAEEKTLVFFHKTTNWA